MKNKGRKIKVCLNKDLAKSFIIIVCISALPSMRQREAKQKKNFKLASVTLEYSQANLGTKAPECFIFWWLTSEPNFLDICWAERLHHTPKHKRNESRWFLPLSDKSQARKLTVILKPGLCLHDLVQKYKGRKMPWGQRNATYWKLSRVQPNTYRILVVMN